MRLPQTVGPTATYPERVLGEPIRGRDGIGEYWRTKVIREQANIEVELLNLYVDGERIASLREYWASKPDM